MKDSRTAARPYAKAIFAYALQQNVLAYCSQALVLLSCIAKDAALQQAYDDPSYLSEQLADIFIVVIKKANLHSPEIDNFIQLLARYQRLSLLPLIQILFEETKARLEKNAQTSVVSAFPLSDKLKTELKILLEKRLGSAVNLVFSQDERLIGGMIISSGDWVMDCSVRNQIEKLKSQLLN